jgi:DHA2 family multidrug resistance protein-like MFS transporter
MAAAVPSGVPLEAADAARDTLGGAVEVARHLPEQVGGALVDAAREAFVQGLHLGAVISAIGTIGLAIFVVVLLRRVRTGGEPEGQAHHEEQAETEPSAAA